MTNYSMDGHTYRYFYYDPLYPFGYGLSYNTFQYEALTLESDKVTAGQNLTLAVTLKNLGPYNQAEEVNVVMMFLIYNFSYIVFFILLKWSKIYLCIFFQVIQVYMTWDNKSLPAPKIQLVAFKRKMLVMGTSTVVEFTVTADQMALWVDDQTGFKVMPGKWNSGLILGLHPAIPLWVRGPQC